MSEQLVIEPAKFATARGKLQGELAVASLHRLRDELHDGAGSLAYRIEGLLNAKGQPALELEISGEVHLRCWRCLGSLDHHLRSRRTLTLLADLNEFAPFQDEAESEDVIPEVARLHLRELIEDEALLTLPIAAYHPEGTCAEIVQPNHGTDAVASPFASLARLRR